MNQGYADQPASSGRNNAIDKPRIQTQLDQLAKVLSACHESANSIDRVADRILGPTPQDASKGGEKPPVDTVERKLGEAIAWAENLCTRLQGVSNRLNSAV